MSPAKNKKTTTPEAELKLADGYLTGRRENYSQVDSWINQVTRLNIWHFVEDIEDVNSIVHLKLFSNVQNNKFRGESTFRTYVQRIARYTCIDQVRSQRVKRDADPGDLPKPSGSKTPSNIYVNYEKQQIFRKIFRSISPECQKLWRMIFSETLNYKEIGEKLNIPEGSVKRKVYECKKRAIEMKEKLI